MAVDYNSSANTFFNTTGQAAQAAVVNQEQISASMAGAGRAAFNTRTGEWFEVEGTGSSARYVKRGQEGASAPTTTSSNRATIASRTNMLGFDESNLTKVRQAARLNSSNYRKVKEYDYETGAPVYHVYGTYVYLSNSIILAPTVNIPIPNIGRRTPALIRVRDKQFIEMGNGDPNNTSISTQVGGASPRSGSDAPFTYYWHVFHYEYWSA